MPRNNVCIAVFAAVAATGALPRTALACTGNACSAVTAIISYTPDNKAVVTLTNKDQTALSVRYSVGVGTRVQNMVAEVGSRQTRRDQLLGPGPGAPQNYKVEILNADFKGGQAGSPGAAKAVDTLFGRLNYLAAQESRYGRMVTSCAEDLKKTVALYDQLVPKHSHLADTVAKIGSLSEVEAEIRKKLSGRGSMDVRNSAKAASNAYAGFKNMLEHYKTVTENLDQARKELSNASDVVKAHQDLARADRLAAMVKQQYEAVDNLIKVVNTVVDIGGKADDPVGLTRFLVSQPDSVSQLFAAPELARIEDLREQAKQILINVDKSAFDNAASKVQQARKRAAEVRDELTTFKENFERQLKEAQQDFDTIAGGRFNFANIQKALDEANDVRSLATQTVKIANETIAFTKNLKDKVEWMADPSSDAKTLENIFANATSIGTKATEWGQESEATLARLGPIYKAAMEVSGMAMTTPKSK